MAGYVIAAAAKNKKAKRDIPSIILQTSECDMTNDDNNDDVVDRLWRLDGTRELTRAGETNGVRLDRHST